MLLSKFWTLDAKINCSFQLGVKQHNYKLFTFTSVQLELLSGDNFGTIIASTVIA